MDHKKLIGVIDEVDNYLEILSLITFFLAGSSADMDSTVQAQLANLLKYCQEGIQRAVKKLGY